MTLRRTLAFRAGLLVALLVGLALPLPARTQLVDADPRCAGVLTHAADYTDQLLCVPPISTARR